MPTPAESFLRTFSSLIDDLLKKINIIESIFESNVTTLVVNSGLTCASFKTIQVEFKELLQKQLSIDQTILLSNNIYISLFDLYHISPYKDSKRNKRRQPRQGLTHEDVETLATAKEAQNEKFSCTFEKYYKILIDANASKKNANAVKKAGNKRKKATKMKKINAKVADINDPSIAPGSKTRKRVKKVKT